MTAEKAIIRVDATYGLAVKVGDEVRPGDYLCDTPTTQGSCACPVRGTIESIRFDGKNHEFVITVLPARTP